MEILFETPIARISWHNDQRQILLIEIFKKWTWTDAYETLSRANSIAKESTQDIFTIIYFHGNVGLIPKGTNGTPIIRKLMADDPPKEKLVVVVNRSILLEVLIRAVGNAYRLGHISNKFQYAKTFDAALKIVEHFQASGKMS